jgi:rRNA-processing protein FCF1
MIEIDTAVITDANILIDFYKTNEGILRLLCQEVEKMVVPLLVLNEVDGLSREKAKDLGIIVIDSDMKILEQAFGLMNGLSYQDNLCLLTALRENYICITNDRRLKNECRDKGIRSLWGLEILLFLFERNRITKKEARIIIAEIAAINNRMTKTVLQEFENRLEEIADII